MRIFNKSEMGNPMKLKSNPFTQALRSGKQQIGMWVSLGSNFSAEIIAPAEFDWLLVDMEHSPNELQSIFTQLQVFAAYNTTPIVRPPWNDSVIVKRLLDIGAQGLLFPMVQSVEEAQQAVAATRYPPRGVRGVSGSTRANKFGRVSDYFSRIEDETTILVQVETLAAIKQAEEIAAVDGIDGVFFGPADIAADMGYLGQPTHPEVWEVIQETAGKLMKKNVAVGTLVFDTNFAKQLLQDGFTFVACGADAAILAKGVDALKAEMSAI